MFLDIFLPEKIGTKRILSKRVAGFHLQDNAVSVVVTNVTRSKTIVEKVVHQTIADATPEKSADECRTDALREAVKKIGKFDQVHVAVSASVAVFKELTVPFTDPDRIRMVIEYEVESQLPFSLASAVIDFIIIDQSKEKGTSTILVVAARATDLEEICAIYQAADIEPTHLTVDVVSLYDLYREIDEYRTITGGSALIDFGQRMTRIAFMQEGKLRLMRHIPRGIGTIAQSVCTDTGMDLEKITNLIQKYGVAKTGNDAFDQSFEKHILNLFNDIQFTLNSFSLKLNLSDGVTKLLFTGDAAHLRDMMSLSARILQTQSELFSAEKIFTAGTVKNKVKPRVANWTPFTYALSATVVSEEIGNFNLRRKQLVLAPVALIQKQWITACCLALLLFGYIFISGFMQLSSLSRTAKSFEKKEIKKLKRIFPRGAKALKKNLPMKKILKEAEQAVAEKEEMWAPFSQQRLRPLEIMLELTRLIDRKRHDVSVEELEITTEDGAPRIELTGFFRSKTGNHFQDFGFFSKTFFDSKTLTLVEEIDPTLADDKGVKFTAKLKQKES